ncbi:MAG: polymorphic toxin-type HINT domain-containing protein, partial [Planctomycetota bacterium]|nr:polymorphic toxin-type HINT domain-containing protein [Planctomycetota bacterium]
GSPDPNPPPPSGSEPPIAPPTVYPPNPYTGNSFLGWIAGQNGDGIDQYINFQYGLGDGASFGLSKLIRQNAGLFEDRADYNGNPYFGGEMLSIFFPSPTAIAKSGSVVWKVYNKFDDAGVCANILTKLAHGGCFVAGTKVTVSQLPYSEARESSIWSETDWLSSDNYSSSPSPRFGEKGPGDEGIELSRRYTSSLTTEAASLLIPIEQVPLGARVPTKNPRPQDYDISLPAPVQVDWSKLSVTMYRNDGGVVDAELLRPKSWIRENGLITGHHLPLNIPELDVRGDAIVTAISPCPEIACGEGSVVTATFQTREVHSIARVTVLSPDGTIETIEGTPIHPIWSVDRNDWVPLGKLGEGETLQAANGIATVLSVTLASCEIPVYNIEVHGEHVYQVGELGLLVHNSYIDFLKQQMTALHAANKVIKRRLDDAYKALDDLQSSLPTNAIDAMGFDEFKSLRIGALKEGIDLMKKELAQNAVKIDDHLAELFKLMGGK